MASGRSRAWLLVAVLVAAMAAVAAGCGDDGGTGGAPSTEAPTGPPVKAGLVSDIGKFNDRSFNQSALEGLQRAQTELGAEGSPVESKAASDYVANLSQLARAKADVTIAVGFLLADATNDVARQFPDQQFAIVDYSTAAPPFTDAEKNVTAPPNVRGLTFATNENSYMIGYMAAKMAQAKGGKQVISAVGGLKIPTVTIFIAGYKAGAEAANPDIEVQVDYSQDFVAQAKCKELALKQIEAGSQAIFQVAGGCGLGALDAAKGAGVWGIGVDRDQAFLGDHILTSAVKRVDTSVFDTIKDAQAGTLAGGDKLFSLANEGVALGKINAKVPQELIDEVDGLKQQIIDGEITPPSTLE